ncbi:hypothetical protein [Neisseria sicca]|uniref:hypothetical protein n=1 Tax=Neisseria sicca TaxID=490 RepID=UPI001649C8F9|nr:hypothetical protein [Neisseria sicca]
MSAPWAKPTLRPLKISGAQYKKQRSSENRISGFQTTFSLRLIVFRELYSP